jgi:lysophospholipase L1-like esterase
MEHLEDVRRFDTNTRWPAVMANRLGSAFNVIEEGHPGRTTAHDDPLDGLHKNGEPALRVALESHRPIDLVLIMLGTNDLKLHLGLTADAIAEGVETLVKIVLSSDIGPAFGPPDCLIVAPPPILEVGCLGEMFKDGAAKSANLAANYKAVADRHNIGFFNAGDHITSSPVDGIHLAADSHMTLGNAMAQVVSTHG